MIFSIFILIFSVYTIQKCSKSFDIAANYLTRNIGEGLKDPQLMQYHHFKIVNHQCSYFILKMLKDFLLVMLQ